MSDKWHLLYNNSWLFEREGTILLKTLKSDCKYNFNWLILPIFVPAFL